MSGRFKELIYLMRTIDHLLSFAGAASEIRNGRYQEGRKYLILRPNIIVRKRM